LPAITSRRHAGQAAINAVHSDAPTADATDWGQIVRLYDQLLDLDGYHLFHAVRADLLRRPGRTSDAASAYDAAIALTRNAPERAFLRRNREALSAPDADEPADPKAVGHDQHPAATATARPR
jgi:RNA polymerase sigma-70 factor (ECF subfamily)